MLRQGVKKPPHFRKAPRPTSLFQRSSSLVRARRLYDGASQAERFCHLVSLASLTADVKSCQIRPQRLRCLTLFPLLFFVLWNNSALEGIMAVQPNTEELLKRLDEQHQAYLKTFRLVHEALTHAPKPGSPAASPPLQPALVPAAKRRRRSTLEIDAERPEPRKPSTYHSSVLTGESSESDEDDELYVQTPLAGYKYKDEDLRKHLKTHTFDEQGQILLDTVVRDGVLLHHSMFPSYDPDEKYHNSHYTIFDVGKDGAPLSRYLVVKPGSSIDSSIWQAIQVLIDLNLIFGLV